VLDLSGALERVGGDPAVLAEMMEMFHCLWPGTRLQIESALARADAEAMRALAHRLRGGALALGARRLSVLAGTCERRWSDGMLQAARGEVGELERALEELSDAFARAVPQAEVAA
jgi:HPt (histidine-containing phosphotransfer) domain-containing protein